jgi:hypothetical protein
MKKPLVEGIRLLSFLCTLDDISFGLFGSDLFDTDFLFGTTLRVPRTTCLIPLMLMLTCGEAIDLLWL